MTPSSASLRSQPAALGLGCVTFGREIDRAESFAMMDHSVASGITFFDTASAYGGGASETLLGEWLRERGTRSQLVVATKILPPYESTAIESAVTASFARLRVNFVDVLFVHRWDETIAHPDALQSLDALVRQGRVRALAASNFSAEQLARSLGQQAQLGVTRFSALQNIHNFAVRGFDAPTAAVCTRHSVTTIGYSPLGAGFLTGKHDGGVQPGSRFELIPGHQRIYFTDTARHRLSTLRQVSTESGVPMIDLALAWALWHPGAATVLVGGRTPAQLDQALRARTFPRLELVAQLEMRAGNA
jgi:1-deoxyxylulose-5-phosphate synthase